MQSIIEIASKELNVPPQLVENALCAAHKRFRKIRVPKRTGGYRTIVQPAAELKLVHYWLNKKVLELLPRSPVAMAFYRGASIVKNATIHRESRYSIRIDLENFFPSIRSKDLIFVVNAANTNLPSWVTEIDFASFVCQACFDRNGRLPIGYPTSPNIANAVMANFDNELLRLINADLERFGHARLTRYADDFVFSTDKPGACRLFIDAVRTLISKTESPCLKINDAKTRYMSRPGGSTLVTGLRVNQQGFVRVHANYRDHVRLLLKHYSADTLKQEDHQKLVGHLAYIEHADPMLFTRLSYKYFVEIARLRGK